MLFGFVGVLMCTVNNVLNCDVLLFYPVFFATLEQSVWSPVPFCMLVAWFRKVII